MLCGHHPGKAEPDHLLCQTAYDLRTHFCIAALPVPAGNPGGLHPEKGGFQRQQERSVYAHHGGYGAYGAQAQKKPVRATITPPAAETKPMLELNQGDMVLHAAFGRGMVLSVMKMGGDALLEIAFDDIGTKKLMAKTASAHMKKL